MIVKLLNTIKWHELKHAYGYADDIPSFIEELAFEEVRKSRHKILRELALRINHQSTVYSATPYVIRFLIQIIENDSIYHREDFILFLLALYKTQLQINLIDSVDTKRIQSYVNNELMTYLSNFIEWLNDQDDEVRAQTAHMLGEFRDVQDKITHQLLTKIDTEKVPHVRAFLISGLWNLTKPDLKYVPIFNSIFSNSNESEDVRWEAAVNIVESSKINSKSLDDGILLFFLQRIRNKNAITSLNREYYMQSMGSNLLYKFSEELSMIIATEWINLFYSSPDTLKTDVALRLFIIAFPVEYGLKLQQDYVSSPLLLTKTQRFILSSICNYPEAWLSTSDPSTVSEYFQSSPKSKLSRFLDSAGLPNSPDKLKQFLGET